jgi:hypothetical protein
MGLKPGIMSVAVLPAFQAFPSILTAAKGAFEAKGVSFT